MDPFKIVQFDIRGTNPVNRILKEKMPIKDKTCPWVIPDGSPFFAESTLTKLYDQRGGLLTLGRDYFFEQEFVPFCDLAGRSICTFIRLSDAVLAANTFVTGDYQSIGAWFVPRNNLDEWLYQMTHGKIPVPWSKIFGVPPTLPPEYHKHSVVTEIGDWYELSFFWNYMAGIYRTRDVGIFEEADTVIADAFDQLKSIKLAQLAVINAHDADYNLPHKTTKFHLQLGNVDNFATATIADELAGTRADLFSTPLGVQQLAASYLPDTDGAMRAGIIPISRFGGDSFIPPNIDGSFEGLGALWETAGFCLENNGLVMMLTNHFDGRQEGLYYSYIENYNQPTGKIIYTGFKYAPASLESIGVTPTLVMAGSNHKVMMVGKPSSTDWYVCLTNGTFDHSAHRYVKCNMVEVNKLFANTPYNNQSRAMIHDMGDYLVLIQNIGTAYTDAYAFFKVSTADVRAGLPVTWQPMKVTYNDWDGTQFTAADSLVPNPIVRDGANKIIKTGPWTFRQGVASMTKSGRSLTMSCPKPGTNNHYLQLIMGYVVLYTEPGVNTNLRVISQIGYEINPATGVLTQVNKCPALSVGFTDTTATERAKYMDDHYGYLYNATFQSSQSSSVLLDNGDLLTGTINDGQNFPTYTEVIRWTGKTSAAAVLSGPLKTDLAPQTFRRTLKPVLTSPTLSGTYPAALTYEPDGELYGAQDMKSGARKMYLRLVSGGYQVRTGIDNINLPNLKSRPLSNTIYETNLPHSDIVIGITGTAAELTAGGVECGSSALSACGYSSYGGSHSLPRLAELKAPAGHNTVLTFPRTVTRTLDQGLKKATYAGSTFYGIRQNVIDKLKAMIPSVLSDTKYWGFGFNILGNESGGMFHGLNIGFALVYFFDNDLAQTRTQVVLFTPVVEAPNADHPGVYWIKDITVLDTPPHVRSCVNVKMDETNLIINGGTKPKSIVSIYRDGTKLKVYVMAPYSTVTTATINTKQLCLFDIDLTTNKVTGLYGGQGSWGLGDVVTMIPKVGMLDVTLGGTTPDTTSINPANPQPYVNTGGTAAILKKTNDDTTIDYYMIASAYPEVGWSVFLQDNIRLMINGTAYTMEGGVIDLRDVDPTPQNKTFWLYATIEDNQPRWIVSTVKLRRRSSLLPAALLTTNNQQILTITRFQPFMIGDYMLSQTREAGIIPVSSGLPQDAGSFSFLRDAELLP